MALVFYFDIKNIPQSQVPIFIKNPNFLNLLGGSLKIFPNIKLILLVLLVCLLILQGRVANPKF